MKTFQVWTLPENKEKGNHNKWGEPELIEFESRKALAKFLADKPVGTWKIRQL